MDDVVIEIKRFRTAAVSQILRRVGDKIVLCFLKKSKGI
jgi:hypothetical protein